MFTATATQLLYRRRLAHPLISQCQSRCVLRSGLGARPRGQVLAALGEPVRGYVVGPTTPRCSPVLEMAGEVPTHSSGGQQQQHQHDPRHFGQPTQGTAIGVEEFSQLAPMILLQSALQQHSRLDGTLYAATHEPDVSHVVISRDTFDRFCVMSHVNDSESALQALDDAAIVVSLRGGTMVHLRPAQYLEELQVTAALQADAAADHSAGGTEALRSPLVDAQLPTPFILERVEERIKELEAREEKMRERLQPSIARAARWRRSVWGGALLYAGTQLAVIARLTYFDLDWDTMEPIAYCLGIGTALLFYLYYMRFDQEHTYTEFDQRFLPRRVRKYAPADFNWKEYHEVCGSLVSERAVRERLREWAQKH